jgi:hypothetical protein
MNRQIGWSTESNLLWQIGNQIDRMTGVIGSTLSTFVPQSRTLTINGVTYDLSANRSWTVAAGLSGTIATGQVAFGSALNTIAGSNTFFWDNTNSYLYLGTNVSSFAFGHKIRAVGQGDASIGIFRNQASASPSKLEFFKSRGTYLVPLANSANDQLMSISAFGWGSASTQYVNAVAISAVATSIGTNGVQGQLNLTTWNNTGSNFSSLSLKNSFSAPGSGGVVTIGADASGITPLGTLHVRGFDATTSNNAFYLENSTQTQLLKLSNDGQMLVGTGAYAGFLLDVNGTARVSGGITSTAANAFLAFDGGVTNQRFGMGTSTNTLNVFTGDTMIFGTQLDSSNLTKSNSVMWFGTEKNLIIGGATTSLGANFKLQVTGRSIFTTGDTNYITKYSNPTTSTAIQFNSAVSQYSALIFASNDVDYGGLFACGSSYSFGTYSARETNLMSFGNGHITLRVNNVGDVNIKAKNSDVNNSTTQFKLFGASGNLQLQDGGTYTDIASAKVAINSTTQGFLPPRMTTTQKNAIGTPAAGLIVYDTDTNKLCCYNGTSWNDLF